VEDGSVSVRHRDNEDLTAKSLSDFIAAIKEEIRTRSL